MKASRVPIRLLLAGAGAALLAATQAAPAAATGAAGRHLVSVNTNETGPAKCLQPVDGSLEPGAAIVQVTCDWSAGSFAQQWAKDDLGGGVIHYRNISSGLCLDARGSATDGTPVQQWVCNSISNERWQHPVPDLIDVLDGPIISRVSGTSSHCLDVPGASPQAGLAMQLWRCNDTTAQAWDDTF
ncbi:RICIN domain-containing protein [Nonomuraea sp. NPDC050783]|uniref:RICIN domain-containing protein n=1 Tax=Nonomuraea sp. NPDC050783 TaxID=3154634 RepID=UPI003467B7EF